MTACRDSDKVQVNAVRALGNLFALQCPPLSQQQQAAQLVATPSPCPSSQQPAATAATASVQSGSTSEGAACSCGQVQCSCGGASCSNSKRTYWWGQDWIGEGLQCLLLSLDSSTDKVWLSKQLIAYVTLCNIDLNYCWCQSHLCAQQAYTNAPCQYGQVCRAAA